MLELLVMREIILILDIHYYQVIRATNGGAVILGSKTTKYTRIDSNRLGVFSNINCNGIVNNSTQIKKNQTIAFPLESGYLSMRMNSPNVIISAIETDYYLSNINKKAGSRKMSFFITSRETVKSASINFCWDNQARVSGYLLMRMNSPNVIVGALTTSGDFFSALLFTVAEVTGDFQLYI